MNTRYNVIGMQGNRVLVGAALRRYFPADYADYLLRGSDWTESELICTIHELTKIRRPLKKLQVPEVISFLQSFLSTPTPVDYLAEGEL